MERDSFDTRVTVVYQIGHRIKLFKARNDEKSVTQPMSQQELLVCPKMDSGRAISGQASREPCGVMHLTARGALRHGLVLRSDPSVQQLVLEELGHARAILIRSRVLVVDVMSAGYDPQPLRCAGGLV